MKVTGQKQLIFTQKAWQQMWRLTQACDIEISALGVLVDGTNDTVDEFYVPKQHCSGTSTVMDDHALATLHLEILAKGVNPKNVCVYWH